MFLIAAPGGRRGGEFGGGGEVTGIILRTSDGGKTWSEQVRGPEYPVASISVVDSQNAYMCGSGGTAFGTKDGGAQWTQQSTDVAWEINDIAFLDATTGWSVGWTGLAIRTTDGGASWTGLYTYTAYDLNSVSQLVLQNQNASANSAHVSPPVLPPRQKVVNVTTSICCLLAV